MKTYIPYNSLFWGIGAIAVGLLILFNPAVAILLAVKLIGILSLAVGTIQLVVQLIQNRKEEHKSIPIGSVIMMVWGALLLIRPLFWADFFMILLGLTMIFLSLNMIGTYRKVSQSGHRVSFPFYIFPVLMLAAGIVTIVNPIFLASGLVIFAAIWIVIYGVVELVSYFALK